MKKNEKTLAGKTKDRIRGLVRTLAEQLEAEYRRDADDLIDPHILALNMTTDFVRSLYADAKRTWYGSVAMDPQDVKEQARRERTSARAEEMKRTMQKENR